MHARRFACFLLGLWLAGGLFMAYVATQNFRGVDRLLSGGNPAAASRLKPLGPQARMILRYQASEMNRWLFGAWETTQLVCGTVFFCRTALRQPRKQVRVGRDSPGFGIGALAAPCPYP